MLCLLWQQNVDIPSSVGHDCKCRLLLKEIQEILLNMETFESVKLICSWLTSEIFVITCSTLVKSFAACYFKRKVASVILTWNQIFSVLNKSMLISHANIDIHCRYFLY